MLSAKVKSWLLPLLLLPLILLAGCTGYTPEEVNAAPQAVRQTVKEALFVKPIWEYKDAEDAWHEFPPCGAEHFLGATVCRSEDGMRVFSYVSTEDGITSTRFFYDEEESRITCRTDRETWKYVCITE